jgi:predicted DsbA family dithiol-disulfide isomerase
MTIDVFADIACPWCYIGEKRLFSALGQRNYDATVRWRPFQLQPDLPSTGRPWRSFAEAKFGGWDRALGMFQRVEQAAEQDRIEFDFEGIASAANTTDAHRLILFAREYDREWDMASALFRGYFAEGLDLNDEDNLFAITAYTGLDTDAAADWLASDAGRTEVAESQQVAQRAGITGVPFTIIAGQLALSGAQPVETFLHALDRAADQAATTDEA